MSTFMANKGNIVRKWYILDAAGKPLGKTAVTAADLLRGKHKPDLHPPRRLRRLRHRHQRRARPSSPARSWSRSTTAPTPAGWAA